MVDTIIEHDFVFLHSKIDILLEVHCRTKTVAAWMVIVSSQNGWTIIMQRRFISKISTGFLFLFLSSGDEFQPWRRVVLNKLAALKTRFHPINYAAAGLLLIIVSVDVVEPKYMFFEILHNDVRDDACFPCRKKLRYPANPESRLSLTSECNTTN